MPSRPDASRRPRSRPTRLRPTNPGRPTGELRPGLVADAVRVVRTQTRLRPRLAIWLGSAFGALAEAVEVDARIPYAAIPGFVPPTVAGHAGELIVGHLATCPVCLLAGRAHYYEGHEPAAITFPVRVLAAAGVRELLLTNAAGGIATGLRPGDFVVITDHINAMGVNPLRGPTSGGSDGFVDLSAVYDGELSKLIERAARRCQIRVRRGVYLAVSGPSYETPAEIRAFARWGADVVGMSTVPEAIVARQCGLRVAGLSCVTNAAAGRTRRAISHAEVLATGRRTASQARALLTAFLGLYARAGASRALT